MWPTILSNDGNEVKEQIAILDRLKIKGHLDVIDGVFADNRTVAIDDLNGWKLREWECHLMVDDPIIWIDKCESLELGRIIGQIERMPSQSEFVEKVQSLQMEAGLAIDLDTQVEELESEVLVWVERVLVMGVKAGRSGQKFEDKVIDKIARLVKMRQAGGHSFMIEVDGGVNLGIANRLREARVDAVAVNSIFWAGEVNGNWKNLQKL